MIGGLLWTIGALFWLIVIGVGLLLAACLIGGVVVAIVRLGAVVIWLGSTALMVMLPVMWHDGQFVPGNETRIAGIWLLCVMLAIGSWWLRPKIIDLLRRPASR